MMRMIIPAGAVPCPVCKAQPGERCHYVYGELSKRGQITRFGSHYRRIEDAESAMRAANALLGG
jgi:hypothetical protein